MRYFLYGGEDFLISREFKNVKNDIIKENPSAEIKSFNAKDQLDFKDLEKTALNSGNLFDYKKIVIVKNIEEFKKEQVDKFLKILEKSSNSNYFLITAFYKTGKVRKNKLTNFLISNFETKEFHKMSNIESANWIIKEIEIRSNLKIKINNSIANKISFYCENNLWLINNQIEKIVNYFSEKDLNENEIEKIIFGNGETKIFDLIDAIGMKRKNQALGLINQMFNKGENSFYILSMIVYQMRNMIKLFELKSTPVYNEEPFKKLGVHPFVAKKILSQLQNFSKNDLQEVYHSLARIDYRSKKGEDLIQEGLVNLIVSI